MKTLFFSQFKTIHFFFLLSLFFLSCEKEETPYCEITSPLDGQNFIQGQMVNIAVELFDSDNQIAKIKIYIDENLETTLDDNPYSFEWNTSNYEIGNHSIRATCFDDEGFLNSDEIIISLSEKITTDFTADQKNGDIPLLINFTDLSTNNPTGWLWDFGDGNSSSEQNPSHEYNSNGIFDVTLNSFNEFSSDTLTKENFIVIGLVFPDFSAEETYGNQAFTTNFYDKSLNNPTEWLWDFGDGNSSSEQNPTHTYETFGVYDVSLTASNEYGSNTIEKINYIIVNDEMEIKFVDGRDGKEYRKIHIGDQIWMEPNLKFESSGSRWYDDDPENDETLGRLYTWYDDLEVCPAGWHLPSDDEWKILEGTVDNTFPVGDPEWDKSGYRGDGAGNKLKSTSGWSIATGTDDYGFNAIPAGGFYENGTFASMEGHPCWFWTSTEYTNTNAYFRGIPNGNKGLITRGSGNKEDGISIRCIKN